MYWTALCNILVLGVIFSLGGCAGFKYPAPLQESSMMQVEQDLATTEGEFHSPIRLVGQGDEALLARLAMIDAASSRIDLQVYIFKADNSGDLVIHALMAAAQRGVAVRLLLDDFGTGQQDEKFARLASHPNIEVKLFNPTQFRRFQAAGMLFDFSLKSRRMHNKLMITDQRLAILGGRNIGDMYFDSGAEANFHDLDVIVSDAVAKSLTNAFELYWQHPLAVPIASIHPISSPRSWQRLFDSLLQTADNQAKRNAAKQYADTVLNASSLWQDAVVNIVVDHPDKLLTSPQVATTHLVPVMQRLLSDVEHSALIVSPYFVPQDNLITQLADWVQGGAAVTVLTNSLAATDVLAVHAGYAPWRKKMLAAGIQLWEFKPDTQHSSQQHKVLGASRASLHAKTFIFDQRYIFIGSLNLDPRSLHLNTELGVILETPALARDVSEGITRQLKRSAYQLRLDVSSDKCPLTWSEWSADSNELLQTHCTEPNAKRWQKWLTRFLSLLPIQNQL